MTQYKFKERNFMDLLNEKKSITIPLIQRDYAQGRKKESVIADNFLNDIDEFLTSDNTEMYLDFVYGTEKDNDFTPLDGQQRLTTLFLLHWYSNHKNKDLNRFSYNVRDTSKDFLNALTTHNMDITTINGDLSKWIINQNWFFNSWKKDPTIDAILNMLDKIHTKFKACDSLTQENLDNIKFSLLDLKDFKLTDELYIKMNGRGRPLTEFENFKAIFGKYLEKYLEKEKHEKLIPKLDNEWFHIFWKLAEKELKGDENANIPNLAGEKFFNFFHNISFCLHLDSDQNEKIPNDEFNLLNEYKKIYTEKNNIDFVTTLLDNLNNLEKNKIFLEFVSKKSSTYEYSLKFYFLSLLYVNNIDETQMGKFKRVSFNLIDNIAIELKNIKGLINIQKSFLNEVNNQDVYEYVGNQKEDINIFKGYTGKQIKEEIEKATIIIENPTVEWEKEFKLAENNYYLKGQIGFLIRLSENNFENFKVYRDSFIKLWDLAKDENNQNFIRGALLALTRDDSFYMPIRSDNHLLCDFNNTLADRDAGWRRVFEEKLEYIKQLLDNIINQTPDNIIRYLKNLINNFPHDTNNNSSKNNILITYILKTIKKSGYSYFMNYCRQPRYPGRKICFKDNSIYVLGSTKRTSMLELFNIALSTEDFYDENGAFIELSPFTNIYNHHEYLVLTQGKEIILDIYYNGNNIEETEPCFTLDLLSREKDFKFMNKEDEFKDLGGLSHDKNEHKMIRFDNIPYGKVKQLLKNIANTLNKLEK